MAVTYTKEMRAIAKKQGTNLLTISMGGMEYQTPSGTEEQKEELFALFQKWQSEMKEPSDG